jgi:serine protease Do
VPGIRPWEEGNHAEDDMKKRAIVNLAAAVILSVMAGVLIGSQHSCEKMPGRSQFIGFPQSFADLVEKVKPAVVNISTESTVKVPGSPFNFFFGPEEGGPFGDFFHKFFGQIPNRELKQQSLGSGFIIDSDGYIITNNHVVEGAQEITVKLAGGKEYKAKVVGRDPKTDLALIKISSLFKNLPTLSLGDSDKMRVGDWVLAIGNPFGLEETVTQGIISATGRVIGSGPYDNFLQTDAPINPGNSGGPLINLKGEVIGINTAIISGGQGIGFAVPSNMAKSIIAQLKEKGKVTRGWIGVSVQIVTAEIAQSFGLKEAKGALVSEVSAGGPADAAGMKRGDIIVSFDGKEISKMSDLPIIVAGTPVGKTVPVTVIREGKELTLNIKIAEMGTSVAAAQAAPTEERLGITVSNVTPQIMRELRLKSREGVVVTDVASGSPAENAGIQPGDVIREANRVSVNNVKEFEAALTKSGKSKPVLLLLKRGAQTFYLSITAP